MAAEISQLRQENEWLERQLAQTELIIEAKKLSEILSITLEQGGNERR